MTPNFLSTIRTGMLDGTNMGGLTEILIFAVFLYGIARWRGPKLVVWLGSGFIAGSILTTPSISLSMYDKIISSAGFDVFLQWAHFVIEVVSLLIGIVCLRDWWVYKTSEDARKLVINYSFLEAVAENRSNWFTRFLFVTAAYFCGAGSAFLASAWPGDQRYFSVMQYRIFMPGFQWSTFFLSVLYGVAYNFLPILELAGFRALVNSPRIRGNLQQSLPNIQIIAAAIFLAYGSTMIYIYYT